MMVSSYHLWSFAYSAIQSWYDGDDDDDDDFDAQILYKLLGQSDAAIATVNSSSVMSFNLTALKKFVVYKIRMLAYTAAGDGVISSPALSVRTFEDGTQLHISVLTCCVVLCRSRV